MRRLCGTVSKALLKSIEIPMSTWCRWWWCFSRSCVVSKSWVFQECPWQNPCMVGVRQDLVLVQMVAYLAAYDLFCYLADYGCEGHKVVVGVLYFLEDGRHPCIPPGAREYASIERLDEEGSNGPAEVFREFLQDSGCNLIRSCCFPRVQVPQELTDSRFWHF